MVEPIPLLVEAEVVVEYECFVDDVKRRNLANLRMMDQQCLPLNQDASLHSACIRTSLYSCIEAVNATLAEVDFDLEQECCNFAAVET